MPQTSRTGRGRKREKKGRITASYERGRMGYYSMRQLPEELARELEVAAAHLGMTRRAAQDRLFGPRPGEAEAEWKGRLVELCVAGMARPPAEGLLRGSMDAEMPRVICAGLAAVAAHLGIHIGAVGRHVLAALATREGGVRAALTEVNAAWASAEGGVRAHAATL